MYYLFFVTVLALAVSFFANRQKTRQALYMAGKKMMKIMPAFFMMLILVSLILFFVPDTMMLKYLDNENHWLSVLIAAFFGSITLMPGFIAFPLCGLLLEKSVSYMVIAAFTTTLMMVGILTFPIEKSYFGVRLAVLRNLASLLIAVLVAAAIGLIYGDLI